MKVYCLCFILVFAGVAYSQTGPQFGPPSAAGRVIADPPTGGVVSPTFSEDELEIIFESLGTIWRAQRESTSVPFENPAPIPELNAADFSEERPFLTPDGLGLYFMRSKGGFFASRKLYYAHRWSPSLSFLTPKEVGIEGVERFNGALGSVSADELTAFLEIVQPDSSSTLPNQTDIALATRSDVSEKFGMWKFLPEISTDNYERGPSIYRDDRNLYFSAVGVGVPGFIYWSVREDKHSPFSPPALVQGINSGGVVNRDPFIAFPGSRLYYVRNNELVFSNRILTATYKIGEGQGLSGRRVRVPIIMNTPEPDAILFDVPVFFNPNLLTLERVIPAPSLGEESVEITLLSQGRYRILYQSQNPLLGDGSDEEVFDLEFLINSGTPPSQIAIASGGTFRLNRITVSPPAESGRVVVEQGPNYPPASIIKIR
ncbi:MAG: hypothetical protein KC944_17505 [Candidatus Omnitrophica bacterium]|nr:hypothetical protein [Candidatus Omnitrophota bacterium]